VLAVPATATATTHRGDPSGAGGSVATVSLADQRISTLLPLRLVNPYLGGSVSVLVTEVDGTVVYAHGASTPRLPASNMKIITAADALTALGPGHRFVTRVVRGAAAGSVVLVGGGDPLLSSAALRTLAARTATAARSAGWGGLQVSLDDTLFPAPTLGPGWPGGYVPDVVRRVRALQRDESYAADAAVDAVSYFTAQLRALGVPATYVGRAPARRGAAELARWTSATLAAQVAYMLQVSDNNVAETLYRQVAVARGVPATWAGARAAATALLASWGVPTAGLNLVDGSGVSRSDRVTNEALVGVLRRALDRAHPELGTLYYGPGLPTSGVSGTLRGGDGRFTTWPSVCAAGRIRAKTGTLHDVIALSGVTRGTDGLLKVFSVLVNSRPEQYPPLATRRAVDGLAATVTGCW